MKTVVQDADGDLWVALGDGRYGLTQDVAQSMTYAKRYSETLDALAARFGPLRTIVEIGPSEVERAATALREAVAHGHDTTPSGVMLTSGEWRAYQALLAAVADSAPQED